MPSTTTATVPEVLGETILATILPTLDAASIVLPRPVQRITSSEPVRVPKMSGVTAPTWKGESEAIDEAVIDLSAFTMLPRSLKSLKTISRLSREVIRASRTQVGLDAVYQQTLTKAVVDSLDTAFLVGSGASNTVRGLLNTPGIQTGTYDPADFDSFWDGVGLLYAEEVDPTACTWLMRPSDFVATRKLKATDGRYLVAPDPSDPGAFRAAGVPILLSNKLASGTVALVDWSKVVVVFDGGGATVQVLDQTYAATDELGVKVTLRADIAPAYPEAVVKLTTA